ncbi:hypothetical protein D3C86_1974530 [compost metagenome]
MAAGSLERLPTAKQQTGIDAAKPETIRQGVLDRHLPRAQANQIEAVGRLIGMDEVQRGRYDLIA